MPVDALVALARELGITLGEDALKHLPGRHDQSSHGRGGRAKPESSKPSAQPDTRSDLAKLFNGKAEVLVDGEQADMDMMIATTKAIFGRELSDEEYTNLAGAPDGAKVYVKGDLSRVGRSFYATLELTVDHPWRQGNTSERDMHWKRVIGTSLDADPANPEQPGKRSEEVWLKNDMLYLRPGAPKGAGTHIFATQVEQAGKLGVDKIVTHAAGAGPASVRYSDGSTNGYYTWPRLGYDAEFPWTQLQEEAKLSYTKNPAARIKPPAQFGDPRTLKVSDLMKTPEGREWWRKHGIALTHAEFAPQPGSRSRQVLDAYLAEKGYTLKHLQGRHDQRGRGRRGGGGLASHGKPHKNPEPDAPPSAVPKPETASEMARRTGLGTDHPVMLFSQRFGISAQLQDWDDRLAREAVDTLTPLFEDYPQGAAAVRYVGTAELMPKTRKRNYGATVALTQGFVETQIREGGRGWRIMTPHPETGLMIGVPQKHTRDWDATNAMTAKEHQEHKFHVGNDGLKSTWQHEFGHVLHSVLSKDAQKELTKLHTTFRMLGKSWIEHDLSGYGATGFHEWVAEAFAAHRQGKKSLSAKKVGEIIDRELRIAQKHLQGRHGQQSHAGGRRGEVAANEPQVSDRADNAGTGRFPDDASFEKAMHALVVERLGAPGLTVNSRGWHPKLREDVHDALSELAGHYPAAVKRLGYLGNMDDMNLYVSESSGVIAAAKSGESFMHIGFNPHKMGDRMAIDETMRSKGRAGFFTSSVGVKHAIVHEFGHGLHGLADRGAQRQLKLLWEDAKLKHGGGLTKLSGYGATNEVEFVAEAFSDYYLNPKGSRFNEHYAEAVGQVLDRRHRKKTLKTLSDRAFLQQVAALVVKYYEAGPDDAISAEDALVSQVLRPRAKPGDRRAASLRDAMRDMRKSMDPVVTRKAARHFAAARKNWPLRQIAEAVAQGKLPDRVIWGFASSNRHAETVADLAVRLHFIHRRGYEIGAQAVLDQIDPAHPKRFRLRDPYEIQALRAKAIARAQLIDRTTRKRMTQVLRKAVAEGVTNPQELEARLAALFKSWEDPESARAAMIGETELTVGLGRGVTRFLAKNKIQKQWVIIDDGQCCPKCADNADQGAVEWSGFFRSGHVTPPAHPWCRCAVSPVTAGLSPEEVRAKLAGLWTGGDDPDLVLKHGTGHDERSHGRRGGRAGKASPQETIKAALGPDTEIDLSGMPPLVARAVAATVAELAAAYPALGGRFSRVGTMTAEHLRVMGSRDPVAWIENTADTNGATGHPKPLAPGHKFGLVLSADKLKGYAKGIGTGNEASDGWMATTGDLVRHTVAHELGHVLHNLMSEEAKAKVIAHYNKPSTPSSAYISEYASTNDKEMMAEAFAQWYLTPQDAHPLAKFIGKTVDADLKGKRKHLPGRHDQASHGRAGAARPEASARTDGGALTPAAGVRVLEPDAPARDLSPRIMGRALSKNEWAAAVGAPSGTTVMVQGDEQLMFHAENASERIQVQVLGDNVIEMSRDFYRSRKGEKVAYNNSLFLEDSAPKGMGTEIFARQVRALSALGFSRITTWASGSASSSMNGYYTWPRLGYDGHLSEVVTDAARKALPGVTVQSNGRVRISDVMKTPEGRSWWRANGNGMEVSFDLTPGSQSHRVLAAYLAEKGITLKAVGRSTLRQQLMLAEALGITPWELQRAPAALLELFA